MKKEPDHSKQFWVALVAGMANLGLYQIAPPDLQGFCLLAALLCGVGAMASYGVEM